MSNYNFIEDLKINDADFAEFFSDFTVCTSERTENIIDEKTKFIAILATTIGSQTVDIFKSVLKQAIKGILTPIEIKEILYHSVAYLGIARVFTFLKATNEIFTKNGISLPLEKQGTTNSNTRLEKGIQAQVDIFGEQMKEFYKSGNEDIRHINRWLAENCFGDYYTRNGLDFAQRELITFCCISAQGGCEPQLTAHALANMNVGNNRIFLISIISLIIPYIGYPRSLNALNCLNNASKTFEEKKGN